MKTHLSAPIIRLASATSGLARPALHMAGRMFSRRKPHWLVRRIASELDCRVPVDVRLGNGMKIRVIWTDAVGSEICTRGYYELPTVKVIQETLKPGMVFVDAGAHVGQYTLLAAGLGVEVHSFEPDRQTFKLLQHNVLMNRVARVRLNQSALGERCETTKFYVAPPDNIGNGSLQRPQIPGSSYLVDCVSLDSYVQRNAICRVDLIKLDVQGAELHVLRGAKSLFSQRPRPSIIVEFCEETLGAFGLSGSALAGYLKDYEYDLLRITESGCIPYEPREKEEVFFNVLAVPAVVKSSG